MLAICTAVIIATVVLMSDESNRNEKPNQNSFEEIDCTKSDATIPDGCIVAGINKCDKIEIYTLDPVPTEHINAGEGNAWRFSQLNSGERRIGGNFPGNQLSDVKSLEQDGKELSPSEIEIFIRLWKMQTIGIGASFSLVPQYLFRCFSNGEKVEWRMCFSCEEIVYRSSQGDMSGILRYNPRTLAAKKLREFVYQIKPHPETRLFLELDRKMGIP